MSTGILGRLAENGAIGLIDLPDLPSYTDGLDDAFSIAEDLSQHFEKPLDERAKGVLNGMLVAVAVMGRGHGAAIQSALTLCGDIHAAPLTSGRASFVAATLPPEGDDDAARAGRLMTAALSSVVVAPSTSPDDILRFRDKHVALRGRFRAAIGDLAESISLDVPPAAALEQARATVANRVEPVLADLQHVLAENRISYLWRTFTAGAAVASGPVAPGVAASGAVAFATHSLAYAFNRKRLIAQHPFGFLYEARRTFSSEPKFVSAVHVAPRILDPVSEVRGLWLAAFTKALHSDGSPILVEGRFTDEASVGLREALARNFAEVDEGVG